MQFSYGRTKFKNDDTLRRKAIGNFLGVDYASSRLNVSDYRASDMKNLIHKDGVNHKRPGWNEIIKIAWDTVNDIYDPTGTPLRINGFWNYTDSYDKEHTIIHAGHKILSFESIGENSFETSTPQDITKSCTYAPEYTNLVDWQKKITDNIKDERSFGIIRGDRLYIFCGIYLVYGTWDDGTTYELRPVEDNEDTYIPVTTIGISANGSEINVRQTMDEVNLLSRKRRNKLIGEPLNSNLPFYSLKDYPLPASYFEDSQQFADTYNVGYVVNHEEIENVVGVKIVITDGEDTFIGYQRMNPTIDFDDTAPGKEAWFLNTSGNKDFTQMISHYRLYANKTASTDTINLTFAFGKITPTSVVDVYLVRSLVYQLDVTSFEETQTPKVFINGSKKDFYEDYFGDQVFFDNAIKKNGQFVINANFPPLIEGQSNIIVEFTKHVEGNADKINKCMFGTFFGINDYEHLFVAGNPDYPNFDFHSSYPDITETQSEIPYYDDLTYFGDLGYAKVGSPRFKITGYNVLEDGTLAIHKEWSNEEPCLWLRTAKVDNALDLEGNVITDAYGNPYQKVYFPQFPGSIGEGCLTPYCNDNLAGDKLFLSRNGLFGIVLNPNIKSNERLARERSRLINPRLQKEPDLKNAVGIAFDNRYYLSVNDRCYIADSRFKNQMLAEMPDTYGYEWWVWDNMPVRVWIVYKDKLAFGTENGQVCVFDETTHHDKYYEIIASGGIVYDPGNNVFTIDNTYNYIIANLKEHDTLILDTADDNIIASKAISNESIVSVSEGVVKVDFDTFYNQVIYLEEKEVYIADSPENTYWIRNLDSENQTFELWLNDDEEEKKAEDLNSAEDVGDISIKLNGLNVYIANIDYENGTFQIMNYLGDLYAPYSLTDSSFDLVGYFNIKKNIECFWATPIFDLGTAEYGKNLRSITIVPEAMTDGEITYGYKTRDTEKEFDVLGVKLFDFSDIDFTKFTFETSTFAKSDTRKIRVRNFNFIMLYFKSTDDKDCAINSISITYELGKMNKGVR